MPEEATKVLVTKEAMKNLINTIKANVYNWKEPTAYNGDDVNEGRFCLATNDDINALFGKVDDTNQTT